MPASGRNPVRTRILILEEHPLLRHGICDYLNSQPDMICCGEAGNIRDARDKIAECKPHLLLTALRLGAGDSLEFVKALKTERPSLQILVYSAFEEAIFAERSLRAGAQGYLMKSAPREELAAAIREILGGEIYVAATWRCAPLKNRSSRAPTAARSVIPSVSKDCPIASCTFSFC